MTAEVNSLVRIIDGGDLNESSSSSSSGTDSGTKSTVLMTRDLLGLGGSRFLDSNELDLDLQVPSGWEKRLDLKSGKVYLQRCNSTSSTHKQQQNQTVGKLQDLNFPPSSEQKLRRFDDDPNLDLKLLSSSSSSSPSSSSYHSVCTLEKVKSALERAEKETTRKRSISSVTVSSSSPTSNSSESSVKDTEIDHDRLSTSFATGCPSCLLYVLIPKSNPKCPGCNTIVPLPTATKKPRIDLNISM